MNGMYEELLEKLRKNNRMSGWTHIDRLIDEAAEAIEALQQENERLNAALDKAVDMIGDNSRCPIEEKSDDDRKSYGEGEAMTEVSCTFVKCKYNDYGKKGICRAKYIQIGELVTPGTDKTEPVCVMFVWEGSQDEQKR